MTFFTPSMAKVVVGSAVGWWTLELASPILLRRIIPKTWEKSSAVQRRDLGVNVVGFVHAIVASALALYTVGTELPVIDTRLTVASPTGILALQISLGYFLWDLIITPQYGYGLAFIIHALLGISSTGIAQSGIVTNWMIRYMLFELSTPALHIRQYYIQQKQTNCVSFTVADWFFRVSYVAVRSVYGSYLTYKTVSVVLPAAYDSTGEADVVRGMVMVICGISVCSFTLNQYWLLRMVQTARRRAARGNEKKAEGKKE